MLRPRPNVRTFPTTEVARRISASIAPHDVGNMTYHNGPVMQEASNSVSIFWMPRTLQDGTDAAPSADYAALIQRYFADIGGSPLNQIVTQYYQTVNGPTEYIVNSSGSLLAAVDTSPYPAAGSDCDGNGVDCVTDAQVRAKVSAVLQANPDLPQDLTTQYYVFLAPHESTCLSPTQCFKADSGTSSNFTFCAYHSTFTNGPNTVVYATMPYGAFPASGGSGCTTLSSFPNERDADIEISLVSREQLEATTDPHFDGWYFQDTAGEIGGLCAYNYGARALDGGLANQEWYGHFYVVQQEWSNLAGACVQGLVNPPANDGFGAPSQFPGTPEQLGSATASTLDATAQTGETNALGDAAEHSIWYSITPQQSGQLRVDTCGSDFDTVAGIYTGSSPTALTKLGANDDACDTQSAVQVAVTAGTTYMIQVDGYGGQSGNVKLHWWLAHTNRIVSVSWDYGEKNRLAQMGLSLGPVGAAKVEKTSTFIISYLLGFAPPDPAPQEVSHGDSWYIYTDLWSPDEFGVIDRVKNKFVLNDSDAARASTQIVDFLLALGGH